MPGYTSKSLLLKLQIFLSYFKAICVSCRGEEKKTPPCVNSIIMLCRQILDLALVLCSVRWILNSRQNFKNFKLKLSYRAVLGSNGIRGFSPTKGFHSFDGIHLT